MRSRSTWFLKLAIIMLGIVTPLFGHIIFSVNIKDVIEQTGRVYTTGMAIAVILPYLTLIPYYYALYKTWRLLTLIDQGEAFSNAAVKALKGIKSAAMTISMLYIIQIVMEFGFWGIKAVTNIAMSQTGIVFASIIIAVFAAVLERLLHDAIQYKSDSDLTI